MRTLTTRCLQVRVNVGIQTIVYIFLKRVVPLEHLSNASFLGKLQVFQANVRLDWKVLASCKHFNSFGLVNSDEGKKFYNIDTWCQFHQHFMSSFCAKILLPKITKPNCKHLKGAQRTLVWLSISSTFYKQLFHTKVPCTPFMCLQFGCVIFWRKEFWRISCS